jgi:hypothetical protein
LSQVDAISRLTWRQSDAIMAPMEIEPYVENLRHQLEVDAEAGGDEARALAERLIAPRGGDPLTIQDALTAAAEEITLELAPGSVELRLRAGASEFVVSLPPVDRAVEDVAEAGGRFRSPWREDATATPRCRASTSGSPIA